MYNINSFNEILNYWKQNDETYVRHIDINSEYSKTMIGSLIKHGVIMKNNGVQYISVVRDILTLMDFSLSKDDAKATYFKDVNDKNRGKKTTSKLGKMIKKTFPFLTQQEVDIVLDTFRNQFFVDTDHFTMSSSMNREDFKRVYTMPIHKCYNIDDRNFTSLSYSCMQRDFGWDHHPVEAYATGDFKIFWIEHDGLLHARCVTRIDCNVLYGACVYAANQPTGEKLIQLIRAECEKNNNSFDVNDTDDDSWVGATFLKIECTDNDDNTDFVLPYVDRGYDMMVIEKYDHFEITNEGFHDFKEDELCYHSSDSGSFEGNLIQNKKAPCSECGKYVDVNCMIQNEFFMYVCSDCALS